MDLNPTDCPFCGSKRFRTRIRAKQKEIRVCDDCGLGCRVPRTSEDEIREYYRTAYYAGHNLVFDEKRREVFRKDFDVIAAGMKPGRVLDIGCGMGHFLAFAREKGWQGTGIEPGEYAVHAAREQFGLDVRAATVEELARNGERFDLITLWNVLDHLLEPHSVVIQAAAALAPGGRLAVRSQNYAVRVFLHRVGMGFNIEFMKRNFGMYHESVFTVRGFRRIMHDAGLAHVRLRNSALAADVRGMTFTPRLIVACEAAAKASYLATLGTALLSPSLIILGEKPLLP
jgi:2-polyprenyl-3-methyl-5-hydroxy-6-metoxy-1,4-benzoquinol methylase